MPQGGPARVGQASRPQESRACLVSSRRLVHAVATGQGKRRETWLLRREETLPLARASAMLVTDATEHPTNTALGGRGSSGSQFEGTAHHCWRRHGGSNRRPLGTLRPSAVRKQRDECCSHLPSPFLFSLGPQPMVQPTFRMGLPTLVSQVSFPSDIPRGSFPWRL